MEVQKKLIGVQNEISKRNECCHTKFCHSCWLLSWCLIHY